MMKKRLQRLVSCLALCAVLTGLLAVPASAAGFRDVPAGYWAGDAIARCVAEGWFQGESADCFGVGHPMNRGAFAVVLCRFFGWETVQSETAPYPDVPADAWYAGAVAAAEAHGAFTRQTDTFRPTEPITREELAAALVRSLGCAPLAGLVQDLPMPFTDVTTHKGYIAMAQELGIVSGATATTFAPTHIASREQVAVMLTRLADKRAAVPGKVGVAFGAEDLADLTGYEAVAAAGARLLYTSGKVNVTRSMDEAELSALQSRIAESGAKGLLYAVGGANSLKGDPRDTALALSAAVKDGGWDGLFLDIAKLEPHKQRQSLTDLVKYLDDMLGDKLLYVAAEAPAWQEGAKKYDGYDYAALGREADRLVVRAASYSETVNGFPTAPVDPLEEVYYALRALRAAVPADKLSLWMTTTGSAWKGGSREGAVSAGEIEALLAQEGTQDYWSGRYACAYLRTDAKGSSRVVWYLDETAARERAQLASCFGVNQICLSDLRSVSAGVSAGLN